MRCTDTFGFGVASREDAEDVTSVVFMKALRACDKYDEHKAWLKTWLLRIAPNAVTDHLRSLQRKGSLYVSLDRIPDLVTEVPTHEERIIRQERIQYLLNSTRTLRKADQETLSLRFGSGLDNAGIAEHLNVSNNAVAVPLTLALKEWWDDLLRMARHFAHVSGGHPTALMLAGLALHRTDEAATVFDAALERMTVEGAAALTDVGFSLDRSAERSYRDLPAADRMV